MMASNKAKRLWVLSLAAVIFIAAGAVLVLMNDKSIGIFAVLVAAIICRVLVINVAGRFDQESESNSPPGS